MSHLNQTQDTMNGTSMYMNNNQAVEYTAMQQEQDNYAYNNDPGYRQYCYQYGFISYYQYQQILAAYQYQQVAYANQQGYNNGSNGYYGYGN